MMVEDTVSVKHLLEISDKLFSLNHNWKVNKFLGKHVSGQVTKAVCIVCLINIFS